MYCPQCRSEFVDGVTFCQNCEVDLVDAIPDEDHLSSPEAMARALADKQLQAVMVGNHVALQETQRGMADAGIASVIAPEAEGEAPAAGMHARFFLMVEETAVPAAASYFRSRWQQGLKTEGVMLEPADGEGTDELDASSCPACGADIPEDASECPDCGLTLG
jgi:hypothetical protein